MGTLGGCDPVPLSGKNVVRIRHAASIAPRRLRRHASANRLIFNSLVTRVLVVDDLGESTTE